MRRLPGFVGVKGFLTMFVHLHRYPYSQAQPTNASELAELDTNGDGTIDINDDPYGPYCKCCVPLSSCATGP